MSDTGKKSQGTHQDTGLIETNRKVVAGLLPAIENHVNNTEFDAAKDGLDFLSVKNSLMLSYLIDLTVHVRQQASSEEQVEFRENRHRLTEMKTTLDKARPLEKKMRYQLDKLLTATTSSSSFATGGAGTTEDPLRYRPDPKAFQLGENNDASSEESESDDSDNDEKNEDDSVGGDDDDDLEAAKATLVRARLKGKANNDNDGDDEGLYRAPRLSAMPYPLDQEQPKDRQKRLDRRLHTSELAQTLKSQYGDAPEQEDVYGASDFGKQREAARRLAERTQEKIRFEEESMVRLVESRKDKKLRKQLLRQESSNLSAISDLGNLVRGVSAAFGDDDNDDNANDDMDAFTNERYDNGKRKRSSVDAVTGRMRNRGRREAKNSLQMALYGKEGGKSKKKKRR